MNEKEFETKLAEVLDGSDMELSDCPLTFEEDGVLTMNKGLVVRLEDGSEFQVTIVQSRESRR